MFRYQRNVTPPAASETATYRQSLIAAGGTAPISRSRVTPPALPATNASTPTPNGSSLFFTPDAAPLRANTNVPIRSSVKSERGRRQQERGRHRERLSGKPGA